MRGKLNPPLTCSCGMFMLMQGHLVHSDTRSKTRTHYKSHSFAMHTTQWNFTSVATFLLKHKHMHMHRHTHTHTHMHTLMNTHTHTHTHTECQRTELPPRVLPPSRLTRQRDLVSEEGLSRSEVVKREKLHENSSVV